MKRLRKFLFFWLGLLFFTSCSLPSWIKDQIKDDLEGAPTFSKTELHDYFNHISDEGRQALYCKIQKNKIIWESSPRADECRNPHIFRFFNKLKKHHRLPDVDFILIIDDGYAGKAPFPLFSFSAKNHSHVCLFPDFEMLLEVTQKRKHWRLICERFSQLYPWHAKLAKGFFRGAGTGGYDTSLPNFGNTRMNAMIFSSLYPHLLDAAFSNIFQAPLADAYARLGKEIHSTGVDEHFRYKYLLDIDGFANTYSRCRWILLSNSVLLKVDSLHQYSQWYYKALKPWVHYVPVREDLSDLMQVLDILMRDDALAKQIAEEGSKLGQEIFSREMVEKYVLHLLKEYAKYIR